MQPPSKRSPGSTILRVILIAVSFVIILAVMIGIAIALGDPDNPRTIVLIFSPLVLVLVLFSWIKQRNQ